MKENGILRVGIIGTGWIAEKAAITLRGLKDCEAYAVGSRTPDGLNGQILLFETEDLIDWKFKNIMARAEGNQGTMWECPNFANIEGHDILIISPQGIKRELNKYMNVFQSGYFIGKIDFLFSSF